MMNCFVFRRYYSVATIDNYSLRPRQMYVNKQLIEWAIGINTHTHTHKMCEARTHTMAKKAMEDDAIDGSESAYDCVVLKIDEANTKWSI